MTLHVADRLNEEAAKPKPVIATTLAVIHLGALAAFLPQCFSWSAVAVAAALFYLTGAIGICLGYHRLLTHRSFRVPLLLEYVIATLGALALQGDPIEWVATHRAHHNYSDTPRDPHDARRGFLWSHMLWLFARNPARLSAPEIRRFGVDLARDPYYRFLSVATPWLTVALGIALFAAGGISWLVWGLFARLVVTYHITWLVNSAAHAFGYRTYDAGDISTNNWLVALLAWGEGWHNNHHAFPASARHGLKTWEFDATWLTIKLLTVAGIAKQVRLPTPAMLLRGPVPRTVPASRKSA